MATLRPPMDYFYDDRKKKVVEIDRETRQEIQEVDVSGMSYEKIFTIITAF